jgi:hypothetical protein
MRKRTFLQAATAAAALSWSAAQAADTPLKFQLDWRFEGPAALFVHPEQRLFQTGRSGCECGGRQRRGCHPARGLRHP